MTRSELDSGAQNVFSSSAKAYGDFYSDATPAYRMTEREMCLIMASHILSRQKPDGKPLRMLEVGAGIGRSTKRIEDRLKKAEATNYELVSTEPNIGMVEESSKRFKKAICEGKEPPVRVPEKFMSADDICFTDGCFDVVFGGMVIHWVEDPRKAFQETYRVLAPGGLAVFSSSGMLKSGPLNYIEHPVYKYYVEKVHEVLVERGYWDDEKDGKFIQKSKKVSPVLDKFSSQEIQQMMENAGFVDVQVCTQILDVDKKDMLARMGPGCAPMYFFGGKYAEKISEEERGVILGEALKRTQEEIPQHLDELDVNPTIEHLPVFWGIKPANQIFSDRKPQASQN